MPTDNKQEEKKIPAKNQIVRKELNEASDHIDNIANILNSNNAMFQVTSPDKVALIEKKQNSTANNDFQLDGRIKKNNTDMQRTIEDNLQKKYQQLSRYMEGGLYKDIYLAKQFRYMNDEMPSLEKSNSLLVTDICYGNYFGAVSTQERFAIYENGVKVTDENVVDLILNIINPERMSDTSTSNNLFDDLDFEATLISRRDKKAFVRIVSNKDVIIDLYVKYCMKNIKTSSTDRKKTTPKDAKSATTIQKYATETLNLDISVDMNTNLYDFFSMEELNVIPDDMLNHTRISSAITEFQDEFEKREGTVYANETFEEFCNRQLFGKTDRVSNYNDSKHGEEVKYITGSLGSSYSNDIIQNILKETFVDNKTDLYGVESVSNNIANHTISRLNAIDQHTIGTSSFNDIYNLDVHSIIDKIKENITHAVESVVKDIPRKQVAYSPLEAIVKNMLVGTEIKKLGKDSFASSFGIEEEISLIKKNMTAGLESSVTPSATKPSVSNISTTVSETPNNPYDLTKEIVGIANKGFNKISAHVLKMFEGIKGVNTEILDNTRVIPPMISGRHNGVFYISRTHAEIEHLVASRTSMTSANLLTLDDESTFNLDNTTKEETIARLLFTDTIKPYIMDNMSTRFLKDNLDLLYTIKELLDEDDLSRQSVYNAQGYINYNKINYIPARELVLYTNGRNGGESVYYKAMTPAFAHIMANESYLSYLLVDGKGLALFEVPQGLDQNGNAWGAGELRKQIEQRMLSRLSLKTAHTENIDLNKGLYILEMPDSAQGKISITDIPAPDFRIDRSIIDGWLEEATGIVGYPASLFGGTAENKTYDNLKKLEGMNSSVILDVSKAQDRKKASSNLLANKLLYLRGGKDFEKYTIEWVPPRPSRSNTAINQQVVEERKLAMDAYSAVIDEVGLSDPQYDAFSAFVKLRIAKELFHDDAIMSKVETIFKEAKMTASPALSTVAEEKGSKE